MSLTSLSRPALAATPSPVHPAVPKLVYAFSEGDRSMVDLLGGKGANLAEMTSLGLPVPPGFVVTTEACRAWLRTGHTPDSLGAEVDEHLASLETQVGRRLGQVDDPLLVSVRSGAASSMPGMMDTVLNIGLTDESVLGLAAAGGERFAWDSYRRLLAMFGSTVLGIADEHFERVLDRVKAERGVASDVELAAEDWQDVVAEFKAVVHDHCGRDFPQDPRQQLDLAVRAVFESWRGDRAVLYRRQEQIPNDLGTAVSVQAMVFGNLGETSGSGVAFTRDPATGASGVYGDYLVNAQGEDVVAGIRTPVPLADLQHIDEAAYDQLLDTMGLLERTYRDLCDIEFTVERGRLWMLQTRVGKRTAAAAFRIACSLVDEGLIDLDEAVRRVRGEQLATLMFPRFDADSSKDPIARGIGASPGASVGHIVLDSATAVERASHGEQVVLVRRETTPDDLRGMIAATGVLTARGGKTSHAAVVARGMGTTCVCGADALQIDVAGRRLYVRRLDGSILDLCEGDVISIDGTTGDVYLGAVAVADSPVVDYFEGRLDPSSAEADELVRAVHRVMTHADGVRRLAVRANADNGADAARARRYGAQGIGLCRTEHMFLGERRTLVEALILAEDEAAQQAALAALLPLQRTDFEQIFDEMQGLPVTVRLLDPPLHEFLPDLTELSDRVAVATDRGHVDPAEVTLLAAVQRLHEQNPMLGLRGVRLGLHVPGLFLMQVRAIAEAAATRARPPHVEIMVPLVGSARELQLVRRHLEEVLDEVAAETGTHLDDAIGTMIELPRAALTAGEIAEHAEFFSFGTNDLTQMTWGFSRDDVEATIFPTYLDQGIFAVSPFESLDLDGVGRLVELACREGRAARADLALGVCGEHGGDPASIHFFHRVGLDYVSCSPFRVPIARLEAARAVLTTT